MLLKFVSKILKKLVFKGKIRLHMYYYNENVSRYRKAINTCAKIAGLYSL
jgi:hypothetical protein